MYIYNIYIYIYVSTYTCYIVFILYNMFQLRKQFVHALLAHPAQQWLRLCLAESHLAPSME